MIYRYKKIITEGANGTTIYAKFPEDDDNGKELCAIDGYTYFHIPDNVTLPEQHPEIVIEDVALTDQLKEQIKKESRECQLIDMRMQEMIRAKYTAEDEMYYARIGTGKALGVYEFQSGEESAVLDYGNFVESVRQWGRAERAKIGL